MATGNRVTVRGADEVARTMHACAAELADLTDVDAAAAGVLQRAAQGFAPRRTGTLRASIRTETTGHGATVTAGVGITRPYPSVHEYGSKRRHITASRYMRRAAETQQRPVVNEYEQAVDHAAGRVRGA
jgi:phage gpG-like protein